MTINLVKVWDQPVGISTKSIFAVLRNDTPAVDWRKLEVPFVPTAEDANTYLSAHYTLQTGWNAASAVTSIEAIEWEDRYQAIGNQLENRTLIEALTYIDNASTVAALKLVLKEIVKELYYIRRVIEAYIRSHK